MWGILGCHFYAGYFQESILAAILVPTAAWGIKGDCPFGKQSVTVALDIFANNGRRSNKRIYFIYFSSWCILLLIIYN
jgi:hypothetical protein